MKIQYVTRQSLFISLLALTACGGGDGGSANSGGGSTATLLSLSITPVNPALVDPALAFGANAQMTASGSYSDGSTRDLTGVATWQSSTPGVVTVDNAGVVTAVAVGDATITATYIPGDSNTVSGTLPISVDSVVHLAQTGQTTQYAPGDDGELQAGVTWPSPRFTLNDCGTPANTTDDVVVTDRLTGLMWVRNHGASTPRTWQGSLDYANALSLCGFDDWRLANVNELESLVVNAAESGFTWLLAQGFIMSQSSFWTSTTLALHPDRAWSVDVYGDVGEYPKTATSAAWAVRGPVAAGAVTLARTGQTTCYDAAGGALPSCAGTGQGGELTAGAPWPSPRFRLDQCGTPVDTTDDVIIDNLTGMMWPRDANRFGPRAWSDAVADANGLSLCGFDDWRLPNQRELRSLVDYEQAVIGNWLVQQGFENVQAANVLPCYWTSTSAPIDSANRAACGFLFEGIFTIFEAKTATHYVWPVRRGLADQNF